MDSVLATRADLDSRVQLLRQETGALGTRLDQRIDALEKRMDDRFSAVDLRFDALEKRMDDRFAAVDLRFESLEKRSEERLDARLENLRSSMTVRLGSMLFVSMGLLFAALKLV